MTLCFIVLSFSTQIQTLLGGGNPVTRKFKNKVNVILDDVKIHKLCYVYIIYGYSDTPKRVANVQIEDNIF